MRPTLLLLLIWKYSAYMKVYEGRGADPSRTYIITWTVSLRSLWTSGALKSSAEQRSDCINVSGLSSTKINMYKCFAAVAAAADHQMIIILKIHLYTKTSCISPSRKYAIKRRRTRETCALCAVRCCVLCVLFVFKHFTSSSVRISFSLLSPLCMAPPFDFQPFIHASAFSHWRKKNSNVRRNEV